MTAEITKRVPSTSVQGYFPHDFFILHIGHEHSLCCRFIRLLEQEGYKCCSNAETKLCNIGKKRAGGLCDLIMKSENYIIWISSENDPDTDWLLLCEKFARNTSFRRHGYYLPYIFRLYGCQVPEKFRKYGTYELLPDFPSKIPEIIEYLKRVPTQEFSSKYKDTWIKYDAYLVVSDSRCTDFLGPFVEALEGNGCTVYCKLRYMRVGSRIHHEVTRNMKMSQSLIIIFDNTFFDNNWTSFKIDLGLHMKEMFEKTFKLIVLEVTPIPDEDLFHFRLFSRITLKKGYEKTAYTHVLKILNNTGILMIYSSPTVEVI